MARQSSIFVGGSGVFLVLSFAALTVNRFAPDWVNADVVILSIMSIKKVTVFYWGQNRLANVLPFMLSFVRDAMLNMYAMLVLITAAFYGLIWAWSGWLVKFKSAPAAQLTGEPNLRFHILVFLIHVVSIAMICRPVLLEEMILLQHQYTVSLLFVGISFSILIGTYWNAWRILVWMLLNGVAIGINFSVVVVSLGVLILAYFMRIMTKFQIIFLLTATMILLLGWLMVAQFFVHDTDSAVPVLAYGGFDFERIYPGMVQLARNLSSAIDLYAMIGVAAALLCFRLVYSGGNRLRSLDQRGIETRQKFIAAGLGCLGLIWFLCFCCNYWVIYNHEHVRYFITAILLMIGCFGILMLPNPAVRGSEKFEIAGIIILTNISMFYLVSPPISLLSYRAFTHIDFDMTEYPDVFAGDYWQVWPAVLRNMMNGQEAYGLSARWQGDREAITAYLSRIRRINGVVAVGCLNASIETCEEQIRNGIGENTLVGQVRAGKNSWLLQLRL